MDDPYSVNRKGTSWSDVWGAGPQPRSSKTSMAPALPPGQAAATRLSDFMNSMRPPANYVAPPPRQPPVIPNLPGPPGVGPFQALTQPGAVPRPMPRPPVAPMKPRQQMQPAMPASPFVSNNGS